MSINKSHKNSRVFRSLLTSPLLHLTAALVVVLAASDAFAEITKGPFLLRLCRDRAALMWETDTQGAGRISYGKDQKLETHIDTTPEQVEYEIQKDNEAPIKKSAFIHKTWLENLEPGQVYRYCVTDAQRTNTAYGKFRTTPDDTDEVTFAVYGDSRSNPATHRKIVQLIINKKVDFVVISGDLVTSGRVYRLWAPEFFEPLKGLAESVPVYAVKGNHDLSIEGFFEKLLVPPGQTANFAFDYGPVHYYCGDNFTATAAAEVPALIKADMSDKPHLWKFVSYHVPSLNFGGHWSDWGYPNALSTLAEAGVDFVLTGHSHQYERFRPVAPPTGTYGNYVTHITAAGGGAPLHEVERCFYHAYAKNIHHFCLFHIKANKLTMDAIDTDGQVIDHLEITKTDGKLDEQYLRTAVPLEAVRLHQDLHRAQPAPLPARPQKNQPFTVAYKLSVHAPTEPAKITLSLRSEQANYKLPGPKTIVIAKEGYNISTELTVTPLVKVEVPTDKRGRPRPIVPSLWFDWHYEIGQIQESISHPVVAESEKPR